MRRVSNEAEPTTSVRSAVPVADPPTISVRAASPERSADVISHGPRRDRAVLHSVAAWWRRPAGRLVGAAMLILLTLAVAGVGAGGYLPHLVTGKAAPA